MNEPKIKPSDFQAEAERLHAAGKLPKLEDVLKAVADVRAEYAPKITAARNKTHSGVDALGASDAR